MSVDLRYDSKFWDEVEYGGLSLSFPGSTFRWSTGSNLSSLKGVIDALLPGIELFRCHVGVYSTAVVGLVFLEKTLDCAEIAVEDVVVDNNIMGGTDLGNCRWRCRRG
jgi:hypothetical protein